MSSEKIPSLERALAHYALIAHRYDDETRKIEGIRRRATAALALQPGQIVLDVGCGTGACLPALAQQVAPQGLALGLEPSEHLLERARQRVGGIPNVRLMQCAAEQMNGSMLALTHPVDAVLFCYTHDVLQSIAALQKLFANAKRARGWLRWVRSCCRGGRGQCRKSSALRTGTTSPRATA